MKLQRALYAALSLSTGTKRVLSSICRSSRPHHIHLRHVGVPAAAARGHRALRRMHGATTAAHCRGGILTMYVRVCVFWNSASLYRCLCVRAGPHRVQFAIGHLERKAIVCVNRDFDRPLSMHTDTPLRQSRVCARPVFLCACGVRPCPQNFNSRSAIPIMSCPPRFRLPITFTTPTEPHTLAGTLRQLCVCPRPTLFVCLWRAHELLTAIDSDWPCQMHKTDTLAGTLRQSRRAISTVVPDQERKDLDKLFKCVCCLLYTSPSPRD